MMNLSRTRISPAIGATALTIALIAVPATAWAHGGEEPLSEETTAEILDTNSNTSILGPALIGGAIAAGATAGYLLLRRRPTTTAEGTDSTESDQADDAQN
jgi:hypothetical protein